MPSIRTSTFAVMPTSIPSSRSRVTSAEYRVTPVEVSATLLMEVTEPVKASSLTELTVICASCPSFRDRMSVSSMLMVTVICFWGYRVRIWVSVAEVAVSSSYSTLVTRPSWLASTAPSR